MKPLKYMAIMGALSMGLTAPLAQAQDDVDSEELKRTLQICPNFSQEEAIEAIRFNRSNAYIGVLVFEGCVSPDEAIRRDKIIGLGNDPKFIALNQTLEENEPETYVGMWLSHKPHFGMTFAFTEKAEATLAKYSRDPFFFAVNQPIAAPKENAQDLQNQLLDELIKIGVIFTSAQSDYETGYYDVYLAEDKINYIEQKASEGVITIPKWVRLHPPFDFAHAAPPPVDNAAEIVKAFPQQKLRHDLFGSTLVGVPDINGELILEYGCLKIKTEKQTRTAMWQKSHALDLSNVSEIRVISRLSGSHVKVGDNVVIGGLQPGAQRSQEAANDDHSLWANSATDTDGACPPPYMNVQNIITRAEADAGIFKARTQGYMNQGATRSEARIKAEHDIMLTRELGPLKKTLSTEHTDKIGYIFGPNLPYYRTQYTTPPLRIFVKEGTNIDSLIPAHLKADIKIEYGPVSLDDIEDIKTYFSEAFPHETPHVRYSPLDGKVVIDKIYDVAALKKLYHDANNDFPDFYLFGAFYSNGTQIYP